MAYAKHRSNTHEMLEGTSDGKYIKSRRNTAVGNDNLVGDEITRQNRASLNPLDGYQFVEYPAKVRPDSLS